MYNFKVGSGPRSISSLDLMEFDFRTLSWFLHVGYIYMNACIVVTVVYRYIDRYKYL